MRRMVPEAEHDTAPLRLSLYEAGFLFGRALMALGCPGGATEAASRLLLWSEIHHRNGISLAIERGAFAQAKAGIQADSPSQALVAAEGVSALLAGPGALDSATAKAREVGVGLISLSGIEDLLVMGALAEQALARGLACLISFQAKSHSAEAHRLARLYSPGRSIVAIPEPRAAADPEAEQPALWIELHTAPRNHDRLMADPGLIDAADLIAGALEPAAAQRPGCTLLCLRQDFDFGELCRLARAAAAAAPAEVVPDYRQSHEKALREGLAVERRAWELLTARAYSTLVPNSERSRQGAG